MDLRQLRKRCEERLRGLELPAPFDVRSFCRSLAEHRGRPINLQPMVSDMGPCGLWVAGPSADYLFYEQETSPLHRDHIILHEASHLLCGHSPVPISESELPGLLFPNLEPDMVRRVLARAGYSAEEEREAELLASLILERVNSRTPSVPAEEDEAAQLLERLGASLEGGPSV